MRRILLATLTLCAALFGMTNGAFAGPLGPIVIDQPRTEGVLVCLKKDSLDQLIALEEKSLEENWEFEKYMDEAAPFLSENDCWAQELKYTPKKILREWKSRLLDLDKTTIVVPRTLVEATAMTTIEGQLTSLTVYVILTDSPATSE